MRRSLPQRSKFICCTLLYATLTITVACDAEDQERIPIQTPELISIPVEVCGNKYTFVVDTGCSNTVFDAVFRDQLAGAGNAKRVETRRGKVDSFPPPGMIIGAVSPVPFQSSRDALCIDLSQLRLSSGQEFVGFVGMDFLKSRVLRINPDEGVATLQDEVTILPAHVERIHCRGNDCPRIAVWVSDLGLQTVLIDTGLYSSVKLERCLFNDLVSRKRIVLGDDMEFVNATGIRTLRMGILDEIAVGPYRIGNVKVVEDEEISSIGMSFLERFDMELDFPSERAYFRPSSRLNQPERSNLWGFWIDRVDGEIVIRFVDSGSVAEKCDIRVGDQILEINGKPVSQLSYSAIRATRDEPKQELKLIVKRKGDTRTVTLQVTREPDPFPTPEPLPPLQEAAEALSIP